MEVRRAYKYRIYPSKTQEEKLNCYLIECKNTWNKLLQNVKEHYSNTDKFPSKADLCKHIKNSKMFSQVAQNVTDRITKAIRLMIRKKKLGNKAGFPRFKSIERMKSFTYPQFGFKLNDKKLELSDIGEINIRKHRELNGKIKTLTIKKTLSAKWYAIFTTINEISVKANKGGEIGIDLGVENFAYLSDGKVIENPRYLKKAEKNLKKRQRKLCKKKKGSKNRRKARLSLAVSYEKLKNKRRDFLHKITSGLVKEYSLIKLEKLNVKHLSQGFLAKNILDCSWAEFNNILSYKAEEAGSELVLVNPAKTSQKCSSCSLINKKTLSERWHKCLCGASMHRDLNAAINILHKAKCFDLTSDVKQINILQKVPLGKGKLTPMEKKPLLN